MESNPYESLTKGLIDLLYAKKILNKEEYQAIYDSMKSGCAYDEVGKKMMSIALDIIGSS